jgi:hypothetical protein
VKKLVGTVAGLVALLALMVVVGSHVGASAASIPGFGQPQAQATNADGIVTHPNVQATDKGDGGNDARPRPDATN